jgi:hypothetical protein
MTFNDVLLELLDHLHAENIPISVGWNTVQKWPEGALEAFLRLGIIIPAATAKSIECNACENHCFMDVVTVPHNNPALTRVFIVCVDAEMQSQMGRIQVPLIRLQQWQSSVKQFAKVITGFLGLKDKITFSSDQSVIQLGMLKGAKGRRWVSLNCTDLSLEINKHTLLIDEALYFEGKQLFIDHAYINDLLNREPLSQGKTYMPSTIKREARKLETQAMYQDWNDEYLRLNKLHPNNSKTWCSIQIAKMDIAKGKDAETIRHNLKI